jgi:starch phosphorylase
LLLNEKQPVQLVIAGKSHPADDGGKRLIQQLVRFSDNPDVRHRIVFLTNYDIQMAQHLYPGCDVWLNNPLRPLEACGTSGMKAALNGCLNLSILDGWWDEWFDGQNGWAIPTADGVDDADLRDDLEAAGLYELIESQIAPRFYERNEEQLPGRWLQMVRHTLATLGPKVLATRMVSDYVTQLYVPAAQAAREMVANKNALAQDLVSYLERVRSNWPQVRVEHVESSGISDSPQVGERLGVRAQVSLGSLKPQDVRVELVYGTVETNDELLEQSALGLSSNGAMDGGRYEFTGELTLQRTGPFGYTVRILPTHKGLASAAQTRLVVNAS